MNFKKYLPILIILNAALIIGTVWTIIRINELSVDLSVLANASQEKMAGKVTPPNADQAPAVATFKPAATMADQVVVNDKGFLTKGLQAFSGQKLELVVVNDDKTPHSFNIAELNIKSGPIEPGKSAQVTVDSLPNESIAYQYYSDISNAKNRRFGVFVNRNYFI